jgi:hypothetical protein
MVLQQQLPMMQQLQLMQQLHLMLQPHMMQLQQPSMQQHLVQLQQPSMQQHLVQLQQPSMQEQQPMLQQPSMQQQYHRHQWMPESTGSPLPQPRPPPQLYSAAIVNPQTAAPGLLNNYRYRRYLMLVRILLMRNQRAGKNFKSDQERII